jgi:hypothetical protein
LIVEQLASTFDAAGYIKLWRDYGNIVALYRGRDGSPHFSFMAGENGLHIPPSSELESFGDTSRHGALAWKQAIVDFLLAEEEMSNV